MDMTKNEISSKIKTVQNELDRIEDQPSKQKRFKQLISVRDYLYKKLGEVCNNEQDLH